MIIKKAKDFILRTPKLSDLENYYAYQTDNEAKRNFRSVPKSLKEAAEEIKGIVANSKKKAKQTMHYFIEVDGEMAGVLWIAQIIRNHKAELGYFIGKPFRGKGIISKAVKLVCAHAFKKYNLKRIEADLRVYNVGSKKVLERNGFQLEGVIRKATKKNGRYYDDLLYSKIK